MTPEKKRAGRPCANNELTGQKFGRLLVIDEARQRLNKRGHKTGRRWNCRCDCGNSKILSASTLRAGTTQSCGCFMKERYGKTYFKHGHSHSTKGGPRRTYTSWSSMKNRCDSVTSTGYYSYGGRGITVCERWYIYENFLSDMGERPAGKTLDRIDVNGNYEPDNCRWATTAEQNRNRRQPRARSYIPISLDYLC